MFLIHRNVIGNKSASTCLAPLLMHTERTSWKSPWLIDKEIRYRHFCVTLRQFSDRVVIIICNRWTRWWVLSVWIFSGNSLILPEITGSSSSHTSLLLFRKSSSLGVSDILLHRDVKRKSSPLIGPSPTTSLLMHKEAFELDIFLINWRAAG